MFGFIYSPTSFLQYNYLIFLLSNYQFVFDKSSYVSLLPIFSSFFLSSPLNHDKQSRRFLHIKLNGMSIKNLVERSITAVILSVRV